MVVVFRTSSSVFWFIEYCKKKTSSFELFMDLLNFSEGFLVSCMKRLLTN